MRIAISLFLLASIAAAPADAQRLGERTTSPQAMAQQLNPASPEEEMRAMIAAADAHPLGTAENPIRVAGPDGERLYLARLRCADGSSPRLGARTAAGIGAYGSVVAGYEVSCAGRGTRIVFDMYQEENVETRAPAGFTMAR